jgi:hypothetical protein
MFAIIEPLYYAFTPHLNWVQSCMKPSPLIDEKNLHDHAYANPLLILRANLSFVQLIQTFQMGYLQCIGQTWIKSCNYINCLLRIIGMI